MPEDSRGSVALSDYKTLKKEISTALKGEIPFIIIDSFERERVRALLSEVARELDREIDYYTDSRQFCGLLDASRTKAVDNEPYYFMEEILKKKRKQIFALCDVKYIDNDNLYNRKLLELIYLARDSQGTIIVNSADRIWQRLTQLGIYTKLDLPQKDERLQYIYSFIRENGRQKKIKLTDKEIYNAAILLSGFSRFQVDMILSRALVSDEGLTYECLFALSKNKSLLYGKMAAVSQIETEKDIAVAGLDNLKSWLEKKKKIFYTPEELLKKYHLRAPRAILLGGIPGCGKSLSAKMIAEEWQLPLYRFDMSALFDKYVGESEKNMRLALEYVDNVAPCVLWADEIEKMLASSSEGSDTAKRLIGQFLFWLQESKSKIFLVATANSVDALPPELFRKGRFNEIFFLGLPNAAERESAIRLYIDRSVQQTFTAEQIARLTSLSEGFSYADIENTIKEVGELLISEKDTDVFRELENRFGQCISISKAAPQIIQNIQKWGSECAVPASR